MRPAQGVVRTNDALPEGRASRRGLSISRRDIKV